MSTVKRIRVLRVPSPLVRPFVTAVRQTEHLDVVLVEVSDVDGRRGYGEAAVSWRVTGESPPSVAAVVAGPLAEVVLGRNVGDPGIAADIARAVWGNAAARSAVECAVADLAAQQRGLPLAQSLTSAPAPARIRTDMTLSAGEPSALAAVSEEHVAAGFGCLKIKASAAHDTVAGLRAVRAAVGPAITLRVDANQAWDVETAIRVIRAAEDEGLGLELVEQPVAAHDLDALAAVTAAVGTPIMADESVRTARDVRVVADRGAADLVNIKLAKTGGLAEAFVAAEVARTAGLGVLIGCMMESHVGVTAAAHLAAAVAPDVVHDLDAALWLRSSPVVGGVALSGDMLELGSGTGLGITALASDTRPDTLVDLVDRSEVRA
ncbi:MULTISPECIES: dipeptide epimerase [unclassified Microbacterium]|uniref:dipeptide epimerase n=1 Tax=unclassified Microbacterium TaxID=2609290 RepID=UPI00068A931C|nr:MULTISPECIES: dipeptide epimerase [unclassified Microbacterium]MCV0334279.1 dipeptide epimerase [Microbacterium sp.]MCV0374193.1 dipeptide epimerase [Microbacterium sp.]MCV0389265.1 dipeptide epimerase [Microbacterium sp.]MCV0418799.1 dipeptide epimerase [Microbacterium sp.]MCV0421105.1 dipeptide epimerase [Microbacterium sp.]